MFCGSSIDAIAETTWRQWAYLRSASSHIGIVVVQHAQDAVLEILFLVLSHAIPQPVNVLFLWVNQAYAGLVNDGVLGQDAGHLSRPTVKRRVVDLQHHVGQEALPKS